MEDNDEYFKISSNVLVEVGPANFGAHGDVITVSCAGGTGQMLCSLPKGEDDWEE